jgi:rhodanese-related sulfurtransferase
MSHGAIRQATPAEISRRLAGGEQLVLVDVRESEELTLAALEGALHYPMSAAASWIDTLPREGELVIFCHHGVRSMQVALALAQRGHTNLINMSGGINLWSQQVDPDVPRY